MWVGQGKIRIILTRSVCIEFSESQLLVLNNKNVTFLLV